MMRKFFFLILFLALPFCTVIGQDFQLTQTTLPGFQAGGTSWGDFDLDGDLDLVVSGIMESGTPVSKVYRNQNGEFQEMGANLPSLYGGSVAWGDYDNDDDLDLLLSGTDYYGEGATLLYRNDNGSFHPVSVPFCGVSLGEAAWLDYNFDRKLRLFILDKGKDPVLLPSPSFNQDTIGRQSYNGIGVSRGYHHSFKSNKVDSFIVPVVPGMKVAIKVGFYRWMICHEFHQFAIIPKVIPGKRINGKMAQDDDFLFETVSFF